jgi:adenine-specific DNA-methyltransferase
MPNDPTPITDFEHADAKRKNLPPAGSPPGDRVAEEPKVKFAYDPHRTPVLRFNEAVARCRELLEKATRTQLTKDEAAELAAHLEREQPWLEWAGKREQPHFEVEPVALHLHERVSAQAILRAVRREDVQRDFFAEPRLPAREARAYYQHDVDWANRLILGDSLQVMTSLARREGLAGQVQMIYLDPPYGIKFSSNWQNEVGKRDVKDKDEDLTREPEMIRAYRDTWTLGVHSYLAYLKQRLLLARELLTDSGSIFVQISDENLHRVRVVMDEVFGAENFCALIIQKKTGGQTSELIPRVSDFILWYARDVSRVRYHQLYLGKEVGIGDGSGARYDQLEEASGQRRPLTDEERDDAKVMPSQSRPYQLTSLISAGYRPNTTVDYSFRGQVFHPGKTSNWKTTVDGIDRLAKVGRVQPRSSTVAYVRFLEDFPAQPLTSVWGDVAGATDKVYVVQTSVRVIERCMLMTTDPGDLVLDPTCGSGTTAFVAEQWGRRWITVDSSRVAAAIARQRLLTASFETYKTRDPQAGVDPNQPLNPRHGFHYKSVPHITLKSIAQNKGLDPIFARHEPILAEKLAQLNAALAALDCGDSSPLCGGGDLSPGAGRAGKPAPPQSGDKSPHSKALRAKLAGKLLAKLRESARSVTDADERRWILPGTDPQLFQAAKGGPTAKQVADLRAFASARATQWQEWEVPFDTDPDWPQPLQAALSAYRAAWRAKMDEVNKCIEANAEQEELVDVPEKVPGVVRVSGPFTVESIRPPEAAPLSTATSPDAAESSPIGGAPEELETFAADEKAVASGNAGSHIDRMLDLLRHDGITFLGNKHVKVQPLQRVESSFLHAEGEFVSADDGKPHRVAVVIGPELGSVPSFLVEQAMRHCYKRGYDDLVVAGFSFDAMAQEAIQDNNDDKNTDLRIHMAQIRPDVTMGDLLKKTQVSAQIFTVFGQPRTRLVESSGGEYVVHMEGVDIYDPVKNSIEATNAGKVAAWFLDTDYDGKVFCICQAFFPDKSAWDKLARALKGSIEEGAFDKLSGTTSLPFKPGERQTVAVKVIDPRGNEVMRVHRLGAAGYSAEE